MKIENFINNLENLCSNAGFDKKYLYITDSWTIGYLETCTDCGSYTMSYTDISIPFDSSNDENLLDIMYDHCEMFIPKVYDGDNICLCK